MTCRSQSHYEELPRLYKTHDLESYMHDYINEKSDVEICNPIERRVPLTISPTMRRNYIYIYKKKVWLKSGLSLA